MLQWIYRIRDLILTCFVFILTLFHLGRKFEDRRIDPKQSLVKALVTFDTLVSILYIDQCKVSQSLSKILRRLKDCVPTIQSVLDNL